MRILHLCLASFYIDNYGYQENILPRMHKIQGHEVMIVASTETFVDKVHIGYIEPKEYINEDGIPVHRIPYKSILPHRIMTKIRSYKGVYKELDGFKPDFIFIHDVQFLSMKDVAKYLKKHPKVKVNADCHADFRNSAKTFLSRYFLHGFIYKHCVKQIIPFVGHFYGTLPARVDFLVDVYGIPAEKTDLLVMGADDQYVQRAKESRQREVIRHRFGISEEDFLIITGGKFNQAKEWVLNVMDAVKEIKKENSIKLLVFGSVTDTGLFKEEFDKRCDGNVIQYVGWIDGKDSYSYFEASDLVVFAGLHSVLWEQAVGQGRPCIFKYIPGFTHIDLGGNCKFIKESDKDEIKGVIKDCISNYSELLKNAQEKGLKTFSYYEIAKKALL